MRNPRNDSADERAAYRAARIVTALVPGVDSASVERALLDRAEHDYVYGQAARSTGRTYTAPERAPSPTVSHADRARAMSNGAPDGGYEAASALLASAQWSAVATDTARAARNRARKAKRARAKERKANP